MRTTLPPAVALLTLKPAAKKCEGIAFWEKCGSGSLRISLSPVARIAVACTLHDCLRARERDVRIKPCGHQKVCAADQEKPELRFAQLPVELGVPASRDINREDIL